MFRSLPGLTLLILLGLAAWVAQRGVAAAGELLETQPVMPARP